MLGFFRRRSTEQPMPEPQPQISDDELLVRQQLGLPEGGVLDEAQQLAVSRGLELGRELRASQLPPRVPWKGPAGWAESGEVLPPFAEELDDGDSGGNVFLDVSGEPEYDLDERRFVGQGEPVYDLDRRKYETQPGAPQRVYDAEEVGRVKKVGGQESPRPTRMLRAGANREQAPEQSAPEKPEAETPRKPGEMREGDIIRSEIEGQDDYTLTKKLGEGGMGFVFLGENLRTGITHAIKFMRRDIEDAEVMLARFDREREMLGRASRPEGSNVDSLFNMQLLGRIDTTVDGVEMSGIITEYIKGNDLQQEIKGEEELSTEKVAEYAAEIALALADTHRAGIIHRDLKLENIFLRTIDGKPEGDKEREKMVKLGDFGIAKLFGEAERGGGSGDEGDSVEITREGYITGTPAYMAPEQVLGDTLDGRTDLYALGVVLFQMVTGELPFDEESAVKMAQAHIGKKPPTFKERGVHDAPEWLEALTMKLLEKEPDKRPQSAMEVYSALKEGVVKEDPKNLTLLPFSYNFDGKGQVYYAKLAAEARASQASATE